MGTTPTNSLHHHHHLQLNQSASTSRIDNLCSLISELLADVGFDQELIIEILLRLPVKSLSKFKCVSKSWLSLISSPQFVRSHYSASSSESDQCLNSQVLCPSYGSINQFSLYSALYEPSVHVSATEKPTHEAFYQPDIVGIVNGLICLLVTNGLLFWNPVLRKSKFFPHPNLTFKGNCDRAYAFGYDESNNDYKAVFTENVCTPENGNYTAVQVYSLLSDSWRIIDTFHGGILLGWCGTYANGKIHWIARVGVMEWKIVSLDMLSDKFGELQQPDFEPGVSHMVIGVTGGRLFVLCHYDKARMDLWVMDNYGVVESWSKVVSIPCDNVHFAHPYSMYWALCLCILRNGDIVLSVGPDLLVYHSKHNEFRKIDLDRFRHRSVHVYVESLVSPHGSGL